MHKLVSQLSVRLIFKQLKAATVESCTGGWIGKTLTDQAGSSEWYNGGLITYSNASKTQLAQVPEQLIDKYGAVSIPVVEAMASGAQQHFPNCLIVAVSGIAGPGGGNADKPVGTVCIATCLKNNIRARQWLFQGDRESIRRQSVEQSIRMMLEALETR